MATNFEQLRYLKTASISGAVPAVMGYTLLADKTLDEIIINSVPGNVTGDVVFNLQKNGVDLFTDELTIADGTKKVKLTALGIDLLEDDELKLNLVSGSINAPIVLGLGFAEADGGSGSGNATQIQGVDVQSLNTVPGLADTFTGTDGTPVNTTLWSYKTGRVMINSNRAKFSYSFGDPGTNFKSAQSKEMRDGDFVVFDTVTYTYNNGSLIGIKPGGASYNINSISFRIANFLQVKKYEGGVYSNAADVGSYDSSVSHRFLRFKRSGDNLLVQTASVNTEGSYTTQYTIDWSAFFSSIDLFFVTDNDENYVDNIITSLGAFSLADKSLLAYDEGTNTYEVLDLPALKAALAALP